MLPPILILALLVVLVATDSEPSRGDQTEAVEATRANPERRPAAGRWTQVCVRWCPSRRAKLAQSEKSPQAFSRVSF